MNQFTIPLTALILLALACNLEQATITSTLSPTPLPSPTPPGGSEKRCGDGVCDGPENSSNCPDDCPAEGVLPIPEEENVYWITSPTSSARLYVQVMHPQNWGGEALPTLVLVPGGSGDSSNFLDSPRKTQALTDEGFVLVVFDPDGRGHSEGVEDDDGYVHQDGLAEIIRFAATLPEVDAEQIGLVSYSYGVTMAAGALARYPDLPVRFFIDWEGPANRNDTGGCDEAKTGHLQGHPCDDEDFWREREAATFALQLQVPYQRLQSEQDHVQPDNEHALLMIANATAEVYGGHGRAPWTRLNDLAPNTVYTVDAPPPMIPEGEDQRLEALIACYANELLRLL
ncbi:MAG: alpha/beta hydrolase family protein [Anaerolineae bacterium]